MKKIINSNIILLLIIVFAFLLRIYNIQNNPPSLSWDEVSIGYNAYSILKTGKDEHGRFLPLDAFAAYGDYKPPLSVYLTVPFVAFLGLNELSVRFPSVIAGTAAVFLTYILVLQLFRRQKYQRKLAVISALLLAISPWHILLSRAGFEANIALPFLILGIYLALKARDQPFYLYFTWIPFVLAVYTFNSSRYVVILLSAGLLFLLRDSVSKNRKKFLGGILIGILLMLPILPHLLSPEARLRFREVSIFSELKVVEDANRKIAFDHNTLFSRFIHNRRFGYAASYLSHFLDHFQPDFLFVSGDGNPKFSIQDTGQLYMIEAVFLVPGLFLLLIKNRGTGLLLLFWLLVSIIPAAAARETPHALRTENSLPVWQIFIAFGLTGIADLIKSKKMQKLIIAMVVMVYIFEFAYFYHTYMYHFPKEYSREWQYGYKEALTYVKRKGNVYPNIVISDSIGRPYMYTLFYTQYDPAEFIRDNKSYFDDDGFFHVDSFGKYMFVRGAPGKFDSQDLYVLEPSGTPDNAHILYRVKALDGSLIFNIFDFK